MCRVPARCGGKAAARRCTSAARTAPPASRAANARCDAPAPAAARMTYRLLVCDLDGILLGDSPDLDLELVGGLKGAMERGLAFSIATGRMPQGVDRYRDELGVTAPMIFYNGGLVRDHEGGRVLPRPPPPRAAPRP